MSTTDKVHTEVVIGSGALAEKLAHLATLSCWFTVTPLPDDEYEISVKGDVVQAAFPELKPAPYEFLANAARAVIANYTAGLSGADEQQLAALVNLGDSAARIIDLVTEHDRLLGILKGLFDENWLDVDHCDTPYLAAAKEAARDALG